VFEGTPEEMVKKGKGYTAEYLKGKLGKSELVGIDVAGH
jgi:hypothetical protein